MIRRAGFRRNLHAMLWVLGILSVSAAYLLLGALPQARRIHRLSQDLGVRHAELASRSEAIDALTGARREVGELEARAGAFEQHVPDEPLLGSFLEDLARLAEKHRLQADTIRPAEPARSAEVVALPIAIRVQGSFSAVHGLISDIERMPRLTRVDHLKVSTEKMRPGAVQAELGLSVFYGASPQGAPTG